MTIQYTTDQLKTIGMQCSERLPPAVTMQRMFTYELQRDSELEQMFHHSIFRLAKAEDKADSQAKHVYKQSERIKALEDELEKLKGIRIAEEMNVRIATSQTRLDAMQSQLGRTVASMEVLQTRLDTVTKSSLPLLRSDLIKASSNEALRAEVSSLNDMKKIYRNQLYQIVEHVSKLDDRVTALTVQKPPPSGSSSKVPLTPSPSTASSSKVPSTPLPPPASVSDIPVTPSPTTTIKIPVNSSDGRKLDLAVPKGSPLVTKKEQQERNRKVSSTHSSVSKGKTDKKENQEHNRTVPSSESSVINESTNKKENQEPHIKVSSDQPGASKGTTDKKENQEPHSNGSTDHSGASKISTDKMENQEHNRKVSSTRSSASEALIDDKDTQERNHKTASNQTGVINESTNKKANQERNGRISSNHSGSNEGSRDKNDKQEHNHKASSRQSGAIDGSTDSPDTNPLWASIHAHGRWTSGW